MKDKTNATEQAQPVKKRKYEPYVTFEIMDSRKPVPVARPADYISLTPVVIPMPIVTYIVQREVPPTPKAKELPKGSSENGNKKQ